MAEEAIGRFHWLVIDTVDPAGIAPFWCALLGVEERGWFVLGFFFYASLFAVAGSIVTRQEDLQTTMTPLTILILGSFFIGLSATSNPDSTLATVASLLPFSSPLVMPTRIALGEAATWEVVASVAISVGATAAVIPIATTIYSRALLRPGRVRIRQVLRPDGA